MRAILKQAAADIRRLEALRREHGSPLAQLLQLLRALAGGWPGLVLFALFMMIAFIMEAR